MNPLDPPHWTQNSCFGAFSYHFGAFGTIRLPYKLGAKQAEQVQKFVPQSRVGFFRNERTRSTPLDPKLTFCAFRTIWVHSGPLGCFTKLGAKRAELVQKFVPRSRVEFFTTNAPDPPNWTLN